MEPVSEESHQSPLTLASQAGFDFPDLWCERWEDCDGGDIPALLHSSEAGLWITGLLPCVCVCRPTWWCTVQRRESQWDGRGNRIHHRRPRRLPRGAEGFGPPTNHPSSQQPWTWLGLGVNHPPPHMESFWGIADHVARPPHPHTGKRGDHERRHSEAISTLSKDHSIGRRYSEAPRRGAA